MIYRDESLLNWQRLQNHINKYETYNSNDPYIPKVMYDMANLPITEVGKLLFNYKQFIFIINVILTGFVTYLIKQDYFFFFFSSVMFILAV